MIQARIAIQPDGDNAILSKKPLGGVSCASCEKNLTNLITTVNDQHTSWNRLPFRDPNDRIKQSGKGFSKILNQLKPQLDLGTSRMNPDDTLISIGAPGGGLNTSHLQHMPLDAKFIHQRPGSRTAALQASPMYNTTSNTINLA